MQESAPCITPDGLFCEHNFVVKTVKTVNISHRKLLVSGFPKYGCTFCHQLLEIKDDIQVVFQFPCLLGHSVLQ